MTRLPDHHEAYDVIQLLRMMERRLSTQHQGQTAAPLASQQMVDKEPLRLRASNTMGYAQPSVTSDPRRFDELATDKTEVFVDIDAFSGFAGVLPRYVGDDIQRQLQEEGRSSISEFLDVFYHRLLSFYYRSFCHSHLGLESELMSQHRRQFAKPALSTIVQLVAHRPDGATFSEVTGCFAFLMHKSDASVTDIERILRAVLGKKVTIDAFRGKWCSLAEDSVAHLGKQKPVLGGGSVLGRKLFTVHNTLKVTISPISTKDIKEYFTGTIIAKIRQLIVEVTGVPFQVDFALDLWFENHRASLLGAGRTSGTPSSLGIGAVLGAAAAAEPFTFRRTRHLTIDLQPI